MLPPPCKVPEWANVMGWGKGSFKLLQKEEEPKENYIVFELKSSDDVIIMNNQAVTLASAFEQKRKSVPSAELCYHTLTADTDNPTKFTLSQDLRVAFVPREEQGELSAGNAATKEHWKLYNSKMTRVMWHCKWTIKGLSPTRVAVHLLTDLSMPPNHAINLVQR